MGDPRPLTTEEARGLAQRWVAVRLYEIAIQEWRDGDRTERPEPPPFWALDDPERERLLAWVRDDATGEVIEQRARDLANALRIDRVSAQALIDAAGPS